jgi:citrate lyase beta subunit
MDFSSTYPVDSPARQMVRRSSPIMPVNVPAFVEKAHLRAADAIVVDLEDSIPPADRIAAMDACKRAALEAAS